MKNLPPAGLILSGDPEVKVITILGSCVAVVLHDPVHRRGGMLHALLPYQPAGSEAPEKNQFPYLDRALEQLLDLFKGSGTGQENLHATLFGGGRVLDLNSPALYDVGAQNAEGARRLMGKYGIPVRAEDLGGVLARKVIFYPEEGVTFRKYLGKIEPTQSLSVGV